MFEGLEAFGLFHKLIFGVVTLELVHSCLSDFNEVVDSSFDRFTLLQPVVLFGISSSSSCFLPSFTSFVPFSIFISLQITNN